MFTERYFIDEKEKVVVCKLELCSDNLVCDMCHKDWPPHEIMFIKDSFVGKAKCSSEDVFDAEVGKQIAYKRAVAKLALAKKKALARFVSMNKKIIDDLTKDAEKLFARYDSTIARKEYEIAKLIGEGTK